MAMTGHRRHVDHDTPLTNRLRDIYEYIFATMQEEGVRPTLRQAGARFGIGSTNGVVCHLDALARRGYIAFTNRADRPSGRRRVSVMNHYKVLRRPDGRPFHGFVPRDEPATGPGDATP